MEIYLVGNNHQVMIGGLEKMHGSPMNAWRLSIYFGLTTKGHAARYATQSLVGNIGLLLGQAPIAKPGSDVRDFELDLFVVLEPLDLDVASNLCVGQLPDFDDGLGVDGKLLASHINQLSKRELRGQDVDL